MSIPPFLKRSYGLNSFFFRRDIDPHNTDHESTAADLRDQMIGVLRTTAENMVNTDLFLTKLKLKDTARQFEVS